MLKGIVYGNKKIEEFNFSTSLKWPFPFVKNVF